MKAPGSERVSGSKSNDEPPGVVGAATSVAVLPLAGAPAASVTLANCPRFGFAVKPDRSPVRFQVGR